MCLFMNLLALVSASIVYGTGEPHIRGVAVLPKYYRRGERNMGIYL